MALRTAAAALARSTSGLAPSAPAVFVRGFAAAARFLSPNAASPCRPRRPAYDERDTPHTDKWLEVSETRDEIGARHARASSAAPAWRGRIVRQASPLPLPRAMLGWRSPPSAVRSIPRRLPRSRPSALQADVADAMDLVAKVPPIAIHAARVELQVEGRCMDDLRRHGRLGRRPQHALPAQQRPETRSASTAGLRFYGVV